MATAPTAASIIRRVYNPSLTVGTLYARVYGSDSKPLPVGNVLALSLEHSEDVQTQPDMTKLGGGIHAEVRRVTAVNVSMTLADINVVNLTRAVLGTTAGIEAGTEPGEEHQNVVRGGLLRLAHIGPTSVVVSKAPTGEPPTATPVPAVGNYEVRAEGIFIFENATDIADGDNLTVAYEYGAYATIDALTQKAVELELTFGGLNEADSGKPVMVEIWRSSQGVTSALALLQESGFGGLEVSGSVLQDPNKSGAGVSQYYRVSKG